MDKMILEAVGDEVEELLEANGFSHIQLRPRGQHLVLFSTEGGERVNRARLSVIDAQSFGLSMADHQGKWESTPFTDTPQALTRLLIDQFSFVLANL
ncbi:hypothetical protein [Cohnella fermenti]|uniref:Uncharacterized protein n=1 Tax=Cohnella fermenti TaxID=2565925 RepID=A0A4S4BIC2_9BACL|nr:hypothetical protein [Cohnella fermenti]THF73336.1 hypothetical protein E6C55_29450 [Cohnella fermenti]